VAVVVDKETEKGEVQAKKVLSKDQHMVRPAALGFADFSQVGTILKLTHWICGTNSSALE
jgi:hypothetical protein